MRLKICQKKRLHSELPRKKKVKNIREAPVSSSDNSCFLPLVTASSLCTDTLYLPLHFTSLNGFTRKYCKILEGEWY
ncbi:B3 domain-containing protein REM12 [Arabidopsis lyrata subsp. lyrata]|uniref:B3 domain-containing protein REM12 n=1 Tax=Arabidopsis lyrata subsp. lyrata TaxID=81972 RepID=UPI000A29E9FF|nr:B3 domain-containing protein REM12 [Arabidopsis lyrata subsp. lyrata]XP_020891667.1 B3 domain-containing protein REM12 [Arabidopsis lyrata subsp. lyrata]|eukprot:XP_020891666.1 B3 domain-containing protein REM12 [Arabidopsis lyrata subsp. lyrata]